MRDPRPRTTTIKRPDAASTVPAPLTRALVRRQALDEQQRTFQGSYPAPHFLRRKHNG